MNTDISGLNENQRQAVEWDGDALLVLAGPGSGKTRVLTYRIANILERSKGRHFKILGLTFTNKAAGEMRKRLEIICPGAKERTLLTTFHAFCADILRQHGSHTKRLDILISKESEVVIRVKFITDYYDSDKHLPDFVLCGLFSFFKFLAGREILLKEVRFRHTAPGGA